MPLETEDTPITHFMGSAVGSSWPVAHGTLNLGRQMALSNQWWVMNFQYMGVHRFSGMQQPPALTSRHAVIVGMNGQLGKKLEMGLSGLPSVGHCASGA